MRKGQRKPVTSIAIRREVFLEELGKSGNVKIASKLSGVPRRTAQEWRQTDEAFAKAWEEAVEHGEREMAEAIEESLFRRAIDGYQVPVYFKGLLVGHETRPDTPAAIAALKALKPEKYRERSSIDLNVIPNMPARLDAAEKRLKQVKDEK